MELKILFLFIIIKEYIIEVYLQTPLKTVLKNNVEKYIERKANVLTEAYANSAFCQSECKCSNYLCTNFETSVCSMKFPLKECNPSSCASRINPTLSGVYLNDISRQNEELVKEMVCFSKVLEYEFIKDYEESVANGILKWQYFGSWNGMFRRFPSSKKCNRYDNRVRPWYVSSSTGSKDVILIVDFSEAILNWGKELITKNLVNLFIETLTYNDYVGLVTTTGNSFNNYLIRANYTNKANIMDVINNENPAGSSNFELAFTTAFKILNESRKTGGARSTGSQPIIIFINSNRPTSGQKDDELIKLINNMISTYDPIFKKKPFFFTYTVQANSDIEFAKKLACQFDGVYDHIDSVNDINQLFFDTYLNILISSYKGNGLSWSDIYNDADGLGEMATVAVPIYTTINGFSVLLGVVAGDVLKSDFIKDPYTIDDFYDVFKTTNSDKITDITLNRCSIETLRKNKCSVTGCSSADLVPKITSKCSNIFENKNNLICNNIQTELEPRYNCCTTNPCQSSTGLAIGISIAGAIVIGTLVTVICIIRKCPICDCCYKCSKVKKESENKTEQIHTDNERKIETDQKQKNNNIPQVQIEEIEVIVNDDPKPKKPGGNRREKNKDNDEDSDRENKNIQSHL